MTLNGFYQGDKAESFDWDSHKCQHSFSKQPIHLSSAPPLEASSPSSFPPHISHFSITRTYAIIIMLCLRVFIFMAVNHKPPENVPPLPLPKGLLFQGAPPFGIQFFFFFFFLHWGVPWTSGVNLYLWF